jgi:hypothetical protein
VDQHRAVGLDHDQPQRVRQQGAQPAGILHLAAGDDQAHVGKLRCLINRNKDSNNATTLFLTAVEAEGGRVENPGRVPTGR